MPSEYTFLQKVCEENKDEYLELLMEWRFNRGIEQQTRAFFNGFNSVFPLEWLLYFDERELELLLCGMQDVDVDDWQRNTVYRHYAPQSKQVNFFATNFSRGFCFCIKVRKIF